MTKLKSKFSLKKKLIALIVLIVLSLILLTGSLYDKGITDIVKDSYTTRAGDLSKTGAAMADPVLAQEVKDQILEIYNNTETRVGSEERGTQEFDAYLKRYDQAAHTEAFLKIQESLRILQDNNGLKSACLVWLDLPTEAAVYLVDASHEDYRAPGCFDPDLYNAAKEAIKHPGNGIKAEVSNTEEHGRLVTAGSPVYLDGNLVGFVIVEIPMDIGVAQRNQSVIGVFTALLVLAAIFIIVSVLMIDRTIIRPINKLSYTSVKYWEGGESSIRHDFSKLQIHTGDEIEILSNSMKQMEQNINNHIEKILETTETLISTRERADEMDRAANIDALTKVRNKRAYDREVNRLDQEIENGEGHFGIAMIDLNFLKPINDTWGHEHGNEAIQGLCRLICRVFRHSPIFRIGGDEFVVILENDDYRDIESLKIYLEEELQKLQEKENPWEKISAAVGYADFDPATDRCTDDVFRKADRNMYQRKKEMKAVRE